MQAENLSHVSTGEPTCWPSDRRKVPDFVDFGFVKRLPVRSLRAKSSFDLSSDYFPVIITIHSKIIPQTNPPSLNTKKNWETFRNHIREHLTLNVPLKANRDIEDYVHQFIQVIQQAACYSTPNPHNALNVDEYALMTQRKILEKGQIRKWWQNTRSPQDKAKLNRALNELKQLLNDQKQKAIQTCLESLSAMEATEYSLWKATNKLQRPQTPIPPLRTKELMGKSDAQKANVLTEHFANVFKPYNSEMPEEDERETLHAVETPGRLVTPLKEFTLPEVRSVIKQLFSKKAPGRDVISEKIVQELPDIGIRALTQIFNSVLKTKYFPGQRKVSQIITILKPGKPAEEVTSYRPISLLPILSKLFEKFFLTRTKPTLQETRFIPDHHFGFRPKHYH